MTTAETAEEIVSLAEDGFQATLDSFTAVASVTINRYTDFKLISKKYHSLGKAMSELTKAAISLQYTKSIQDLELKAKDAREFVAFIYPTHIPQEETGRTITNIASITLIKLLKIAELYRKIEIYSEQLSAGQNTFGYITNEAYKLQSLYDGVIEIYTYSAELKPLRERNHLTDIFPRIASIQRSTSKGSTLRVGPE